MAAASLLWPRSDTPAARGQMLEELRKVEGRFFGQALDSGAGHNQRSPFSILPSEGGYIYRYRDHGVPDPRTQPGLRYLGYGLFDDRNRVPEALMTRTPVERLRLHLRLHEGPAELPQLLAATLWLWLSLGGLGARSRRGFGSLRVHPVPGAAELPWPSPLPSLQPPAERAELLSQLINGVDAALDVFRQVLSRHSDLPLEIAGGAPHRQIRTLAGLQSAQALPLTFHSPGEALEFTGSLLRDFRSTLRRNALGLAPLPDYFSVKEALQTRFRVLPRTVARAAFGLPLPFYFRSLNGQKCRLEPRGRDRMPSPLHLRVHALRQGFALVLLNFTENMDVMLGETLTIDGTPLGTPDGRLLQQFVEWATAEAAASPLARRPAPGATGGRR